MVERFATVTDRFSGTSKLALNEEGFWVRHSDYEALAARVAGLEAALKDTTAHLVAATSLLSRSPKTAAPSNKMFDQMVKDYKASAERARAALSKQPTPATQVEQIADLGGRHD